MSGHDTSSSDRLPSSYSSELHGAVPALVSPGGSGGSGHADVTPVTSSSSEVPTPARTVPDPARTADDELNSRLADHDRATRHNPDRERSREPRTPHHSIATPTTSRPATRASTPLRSTPAPSPTYDDRVSGLQGEVHELTRRLRRTESQAALYGQKIEQQASEGIAAVYLQEELMKQKFDEWGAWSQ